MVQPKIRLPLRGAPAEYRRGAIAGDILEELLGGRGSRKRHQQHRVKYMILLKKNGAGEGIRTLDPDLGKVVLYH